MDAGRFEELKSDYIKLTRHLLKDTVIEQIPASEIEELENYKKTAWEDSDNPFLQDTKNSKISLAFDIHQNGQIFPIFYKEMKGKKYPVLGSHRILSAHLLKKKTGFDLAFTCVKIPDEYFKKDSLFFRGRGDFPVIFNPPIRLTSKKIYTSDCWIKEVRRLSKEINSILFKAEGVSFDVWEI